MNGRESYASTDIVLNDRSKHTTMLTEIKSEVTMDYNVCESSNNYCSHNRYNVFFNFAFNHKHDQTSMYTKLQ